MFALKSCKPSGAFELRLQDLTLPCRKLQKHQTHRETSTKLAMVSDFARGHNELSRAQAVSILLVMAVRHMIGPMRHWQYLRASRAIVTQTFRGENCFFI